MQSIVEHHVVVVVAVSTEAAATTTTGTTTAVAEGPRGGLPVGDHADAVGQPRERFVETTTTQAVA